MAWTISGTRRTSRWPSSTNTGIPAGTVLTASGGVTASAAGQVISGLDISGTVDVLATGVVIRNCRINAGTAGFWCVRVDSGSVTIQDCELLESAAAVIVGDGWTMERCNVHSAHGDGGKLGNNVTVRDNWFHDFATLGGQHADGLQLQNGLVNVLVEHNSINVQQPDDPGNSAVFIKNDQGPAGAGPVVVNNNLLGGGQFTLFAVPGASGLAQNGITITNNQFMSNALFGADAVSIPVTWSGNTWFDGPDVGQVITP